MNEFCIYSKRCFLNNGFVEATIHIIKGKIYSINEGKIELNSVIFIDYGNLIIMPGVIDAHVHVNEPGRTDWEGFDTATKAAAIGGVTTLIDMPLNANPVTKNVAAFTLKKDATENQLHVNCGFYGGILPDNNNDIEDLITSGVFGIKGFLTHSGIEEFPNIEKHHLEAIAPILKKHDVPLLLHCELDDTDIPEVIDFNNYKEYLNSRPQRWEANAIHLALELQKKYDIKVHIVHLSASECINTINSHRKNNKRVSVETCPHYLFFDAESIPNASPIFKCAPPIRELQNNDLLWKAILDGTIDFISSDHSPAPPEIKQLDSGNFFEAWGGISGLQFTLSIMTTLANRNSVPIEIILPKLTENPAKFLGLDTRKGFLKKGYDADIIIYDDKKEMLLKENMIYHRHKKTPYLNYKLKGEVIHTIVNGSFVVENSKITTLNKGHFIRRNDNEKNMNVLTNIKEND